MVKINNSSTSNTYSSSILHINTCFNFNFLKSLFFYKKTQQREINNMKKIISLFVGTLLLTVMTVTGANSAQTLKCQTVISAKADEVRSEERRVGKEC